MKKKPQPKKSTKESKPVKAAAAVPAASLSPVRAVRASEEKWTAPVINLGHTTLPSLLFWAQARLGLSPEQLNVLLQLIEHWWNADRNPHPKKDTIANRMGKSPRQVQRYLTQLEEKKFIQRIERFRGVKAQTSNAYDLSGLVQQLQKLEPEFARIRRAERTRRQKAESAATA